MRARPSFMSFRPRISLAFNHSDDEDEDDMKMQMSDSQSKSPSGHLLRPPARKGSAIYHSRLLVTSFSIDDFKSLKVPSSIFYVRNYLKVWNQKLMMKSHPAWWSLCHIIHTIQGYLLVFTLCPNIETINLRQIHPIAWFQKTFQSYKLENEVSIPSSQEKAT